MGAPRRNLLASLGAAAIARLADVGAVLRLLGTTAYRWRGIERRSVGLQAYQLANRSAFFITVVMGFAGVILVVQASSQARRIVGDLSPIGPAFLQLLVREFGPTIVAFMVAARYGAGVAAEIGAMRVTEQIDALRMAGAEPVSYLVGPRLLGALIGIVPLVVLGTGVAFVAGGVAAHQLFGVGWATYFSLHLVGGGDVAIALCKSLAFGLAVAAVACYAGLRATGGAPGVGRASTYAVIAGSLSVLALDLAIGTVGYMIEVLL